MYNRKELSNEGKHDFSETDVRYAIHPGASTYSVGIFKLEKTKAGNMLKRTKAVMRVRSDAENKHLMEQTCRQICALLDRGMYQGPRTFIVGEHKLPLHTRSTYGKGIK